MQMNIKKKEQERSLQDQIRSAGKNDNKKSRSKSARKRKKKNLNKAIMEKKSQECRSNIGPDCVQPPNHCPDDLLC